MVVTKILEQTLTAGSTSITFTDNDIPNSLIRVYSNDDDLYPTQRIVSGNTLTIKYESQTTNKSIAVELVKEDLDIIDDLTTSSSDAALSAKQGKVLKDLIDGFNVDVSADDVSYDNTSTGMTADNVQSAIDEVFQSVSDGKELIADAITDKGVTTSASDTFSTMATNIENIPSGGAELDLPNVTSLGVNTSWTNPITYTATADGLLMIYTGDSHAESRASSVTINGESVTFGTIALYEWFYMGHALTFVFVKTGDVVRATYSTSRKYQLLFIPYSS